MSAARKLRIFRPDESPVEIDPNTSLTLSLEQISALAAQITSQLRLPPAASEDSAHRLTEPVRAATGNNEPLTLRRAFESFYHRHKAMRSEVRWGDFRALVHRCEDVWKGQGRDLREMAAPDWQSTFEAVPSWRSRRAWEKSHRCLYQILFANCKQTLKNRCGIPLGEFIPLEADALPIWDIPPEQWFLKRGEEPEAALPALSLEEFDRVLKACERTDDPAFWKTVLSFWLFCSMRRTDTFSRLGWFSPRTRMGVDLSRRWLRWKNTKPPHELYDIPLPAWLVDGFGELANRGTSLVFFKTNLRRKLYGTLDLICAEAKVDSRTPQDFRKTGSTWWRMTAPQHENRFTAHKEQTVLGKHYVQLNEQQLREIAEAFPRPSVPLV